MLKPYLQNGRIEAGCDEAGRGCLAGPVFAAAVILPEDFKDETLNDSKQLSALQRKNLRQLIEREAIDFAVASLNPEEIDRINIFQASYKAMHLAINQLTHRPEHLLIDGNRFVPHPENIPYSCIIKGDGKYFSIAAASILAKTYRDDFMEKAHDAYPEYQWNSNKGYPTKAHREAIKRLGPTPLHRMSFKLLPEQLEIDFKS